MISRIALALTVAAISTGAAAQQSKAPILPMKVIEITPSGTAAQTTAAAPSEISTALKDACVVEAISRLPRINGMRVTHSSYEFDSAEKGMILGRVSVSIEVNGHQARYNWVCGVGRSGDMILNAYR